MRLIKEQSGQAMTEMLVAFSFVVVPLFILIPMAAKFIDMKQATVTAARYVTWEQTVTWQGLDSNSSVAPEGFKALNANNLPAKSEIQLRGEVETRIFSEAGACIQPYGATELKAMTRGDSTCQAATNQLGRKLWNYHDGRTMVSIGNNGFSEVTDKSGATGTIPGIYTVINTAGQILESVTGVLGVLSDGRTFDVIRNVGHSSSSTVVLPVASLPNYGNIKKDDSLMYIDAPLEISARGAIVSEGWAAGGPTHLKNRAQALVPTAILGDLFNIVDIPYLGTPQDILAAVLLSPELGSQSLQFGGMDTDLLPRDKYDDPEAPDFDDPDRPLCNEAGYCRD